MAQLGRCCRCFHRHDRLVPAGRRGRGGVAMLWSDECCLCVKEQQQQQQQQHSSVHVSQSPPRARCLSQSHLRNRAVGMAGPGICFSSLCHHTFCRHHLLCHPLLYCRISGTAPARPHRAPCPPPPPALAPSVMTTPVGAARDAVTMSLGTHTVTAAEQRGWKAHPVIVIPQRTACAAVTGAREQAVRNAASHAHRHVPRCRRLDRAQQQRELRWQRQLHSLVGRVPKQTFASAPAAVACGALIQLGSQSAGAHRCCTAQTTQ